MKEIMRRSKLKNKANKSDKEKDNSITSNEIKSVN